MLRGYKHAMVLAQADASVVGFMEVGMLPSPLPRTEAGADETFPDVPYIGNLCVDPGYRRRGHC